MSTSLSPRRTGFASARLWAMAMLIATPVLASGGHSPSSLTAPAEPSGQAAPSESSNVPSGADDLTTCAKGRLWDVRHKRCVRLHSEVLPDDSIADYAYALAKASRYDEALDVLALMRDPNTAEALNYRGYATRKLGRTDEGIGYYLRSIALDPHYAKVREYLGEAYVIKGRIDLAKDQLGTIRTLCGTACEPYRDLSEAIAKAPAR